MEQAITYVLDVLIKLAENHSWISVGLMIVGGLYIFLSATRATLTGLVKLTKTDKDDKIIATVFAILDKYAWGFGKLGEYYETKTKEKKDNK